MAATQLKLRRGTSAQHSSFTGAAGEITVVTDDWSLRVHDGVTAGGKPISGGGGSLSALSDVAATGANAPSNGQVLVYDSATSQWKPGSSGGGGGGTVQVYRYLSSGTWTKPANLQFARVVVVSPGSGGNSGSTYSYQGNWLGGWGGWNGRCMEATFHADEIPSSVSVLIGAPGVGGVYTGAIPGTYPDMNALGTAGGSAAFGDLLYAPTGVPGVTSDKYENEFWERSTRTDDWFPLPTYGGSGGGNYYAGSLPGYPVKDIYSSLGRPENRPRDPASGGAGASYFQNSQWYNGTLTNVNSFWWFAPGSAGGEGFAMGKPPITQPQKALDPNWDGGRPHGRSTAGVLGNVAGAATSGVHNGYGYAAELASLGGAGALSAQQLAALKRKWWGCGGGGGGVAFDTNTNTIQIGNGADGTFPGGGGGGGAGAALTSFALTAPASGGNGGAGAVFVYCHIGSSSFAYLT